MHINNNSTYMWSVKCVLKPGTSHFIIYKKYYDNCDWWKHLFSFSIHYTLIMKHYNLCKTMDACYVHHYHNHKMYSIFLNAIFITHSCKQCHWLSLMAGEDEHFALYNNLSVFCNPYAPLWWWNIPLKFRIAKFIAAVYF